MNVKQLYKGNMETYGTMVFLSKEAEENFSKLNEKELDFVATFLAHNIAESERKIQNDFLKRSVAEHKPTSDLT